MAHGSFDDAAGGSVDTMGGRAGALPTQLSRRSPTFPAGSSATPSTSAGATSAQPHRGRTWLRNYRRSLIVTDVVVVSAVVLTSQSLRLEGSSAVRLEGFGSLSYWLVSGLLSALWLLALGINGAWDRKIIGSGPREYARIIRASLFLFGLIAVISYLSRAEVARSYLAIALPLGLFGICGGHWVWRRLLDEHRRAGSHLSAVLVVGDVKSSLVLAARLRDTPSAGFRVVGLCLPGDGSGLAAIPVVEDGLPVMGDLSDVLAAVSRSGADMVAVTASEAYGTDEIRLLARKLEGTGVALTLVPALTDIAGPRIHIRPVAGLPLLYVEEPVFKGSKLIIKTTVDLLGAGLLVLALSPLLLVIAVAVKVGDRGPVFYRQERVGRGGTSFRVWKFRSMNLFAEREINRERQLAGQQNEVFFKSATDERITTVGRFLRRSSLDELPQLFNVLGGTMSLVGPRPLVPGEGAELVDFLHRRTLVRPGITGLWQVSGRSEVSSAERIRLDFYYVENWSLVGDLAIMGRTVRTVLSQRGAW